MVADILTTKTTAEWMALFERCDIPCAPMNDLDALIDDPHLAAVGFFQTQAHPTEGQVRYTGIPSRWNGAALADHPSRPAVWASTASRSSRKRASPAADIDALLKSGATIDGRPSAATERAASGRIALKSPMP